MDEFGVQSLRFNSALIKDLLQETRTGHLFIPFDSQGLNISSKFSFQAT